MPIQFSCPKCSQKATLTTSKPGDWIECPGCDATVQIPDAAPVAPKSQAPAPAARRVASAPAPARRAAPAPAPRDLEDEDEPKSPWSDKRVQVAAIGGGLALLLVGLLTVVLLVQKPKKQPEVVQNEPQPTTPQPAPKPPEPAPKPKVEPKVEPKVTPKVEPKTEPKTEPKVEPKEGPKVEPKLPMRLDQFGNPVGQDLGLAKQDEFKGQRLLFWSPHTGSGDMFFRAQNPLWKALEEKGFVIRREFGKFRVEWLKETDQLWILSTADEATLQAQRKLVGNMESYRRDLQSTLASLTPAQREEVRKKVGAKFPKGKLEDIIELDIGDTALSFSPSFHLTAADYRAIVEFAKSGKGLCLLSDNDPFTHESNQLSRQLFNAGVAGNYQGEKIAYVKNRQLTPEMIAKYKGDYEVDDHPLLTGVNFVYEGITISHPAASNKLEVALRASDGQPVIAVAKEPGLRVIIDCGFTRYCHGPNDDVSFILMTAGTTRLAQNMAAYLAGKGTPPAKADPKRPEAKAEFSKLDQFGNPTHQDAGLAKQDEFKGQKLLFWCASAQYETLFLGPTNPLWKALEEKGFVVRRVNGPFNAKWLKETDQIWIMSVANYDGATPKAITESDYVALEEFVKAGKGLCLLADNDPFVIEANELAKRLYGAKVSGNYAGEQVAYVGVRRLAAAVIKQHGGQYEVADHPLLAGVNFVWEGVTVSNVSPSKHLETALAASDGKPLVVVSKVPGQRVVIDCGFTRYSEWAIRKTAGTTRLAQNVAAYLAGKADAKKP